jgi:hypothetical protein
MKWVPLLLLLGGCALIIGTHNKIEHKIEPKGEVSLGRSSPEPSEPAARARVPKEKETGLSGL